MRAMKPPMKPPAPTTRSDFPLRSVFIGIMILLFAVGFDGREISGHRAACHGFVAEPADIFAAFGSDRYGIVSVGY